MTNDQRARNLLMGIWDAPDRETCFALIDTAFAEIKSDTLRDAENAAFEALTRHGFTGARYCVIAAIRGLIDAPTEPAAPDPTKALAKLFATLWNERWNQSDEERTAWHYRGIEVGLLDGSELENERISLSALGRAALRLAEGGG